MKLLLPLCLLLAAPAAASAQEFNVRAGDREAIIPSREALDGAYNGRFHYAPAVRAGDYIWISGVVAGAMLSPLPGRPPPRALMVVAWPTPVARAPRPSAR